MARAKVYPSLRVTLRPYARCTEQECPWAMGVSNAARDGAKHHTATTGHDTEVIIQEVTFYKRREIATEQPGAPEAVARSGKASDAGDGDVEADPGPHSGDRG